MRILVVDDDALIRRWLKMMLEQMPNEHISVVLAENGLKALSCLQENPDIALLITDIKMPQMDGLELCQRVTKDYPNLPVAILSSFEEFSFVRKALQMGAIDYILKASMNTGDVAQIIKKARARKSAVKEGSSGLTSLSHNRKLLEAYWKSDRTNGADFLRKLNPGLTLENVTFIALDAANAPEDVFEEASAVFAGDSMAFVYYEKNIYVGFFAVSDKNSEKSTASSCLAFLQKNGVAVQYWSIVFSGQNVDADVDERIQKAVRVLQFKTYYNLSEIKEGLYHEIGELAPTTHVAEYKEFFEASSSYWHDRMITLIQTCLERFHEAYLHPADINDYLHLMCHKLLAEVSVAGTDSVHYEAMNRQLKMLNKAKNKEEKTSALAAYLTIYQSAIGVTNKKHSEAVLQTIDYIEKHYSEKITLEHIAEMAYLNTTYMSELFKKEMGISLNEYINSVRIIHACTEIRLTRAPIGQIAENCGFTDQNYFTKVFKKITGNTPTKYRDNIGKDTGKY